MSEKYQNRIANMVICYANEDEVISYAKQLAAQTYAGAVTLIVTVNKLSNPDERYLYAELKKTGIDFDIVEPGRNLGYLNGLVYGYDKSEKCRDCGWLIFSNTDIEISDNAFMEKFLQSKTAKKDDIWMIGPDVYNPAGNHHVNPYMKKRPDRFFYLKKIAGMSFPHIYDLLYRMKKKKSTGNTKKKSGYAYSVHGSFFFLRNELAGQLANRKPWELLYDEEQYLAEICLKENKKVYYDSSLNVNHLEGSSTGKVNLSKRYRLMKKSNLRIVREFY